MGMQTEHTEKKTKRAYEKPRVRVIELVAEEVLAIGCKTPSLTAPLSPINCLANSCQKRGS